MRPREVNKRKICNEYNYLKRHNAKTKDPYQRYEITQTLLHARTGVKKHLIRDFLEANREDLAEHNSLHGITPNWNLKRHLHRRADELEVIDTTNKAVLYSLSRYARCFLDGIRCNRHAFGEGEVIGLKFARASQREALEVTVKGRAPGCKPAIIKTVKTSRQIPAEGLQLFTELAEMTLIWSVANEL